MACLDEEGCWSWACTRCSFVGHAEDPESRDRDIRRHQVAHARTRGVRDPPQGPALEALVERGLAPNVLVVYHEAHECPRLPNHLKVVVIQAITDPFTPVWYTGCGPTSYWHGRRGCEWIRRGERKGPPKKSRLGAMRNSNRRPCPKCLRLEVTT
jgi:hypothetical protein